MAERDLSRHAREADKAERPGGVLAAEADLDEIARLVHLHGVPGEKRAGITDRAPPEGRRAERRRERPVAAARRVGRRAARRRRIAIGMKTDLLRPRAHQQIERRERE